MMLIVSLHRNKELMDVHQAKTSILVLSNLNMLVIIEIDQINRKVIWVLSVVGNKEWRANELNPSKLFKSKNKTIQLLDNILK